MMERRVGKIYQFLADDMIESCVESKSSPDRLSCLALLEHLKLLKLKRQEAAE